MKGWATGSSMGRSALWPSPMFSFTSGNGGSWWSCARARGRWTAQSSERMRRGSPSSTWCAGLPPTGARVRSHAAREKPWRRRPTPAAKSATRVPAIAQGSERALREERADAGSASDKRAERTRREPSCALAARRYPAAVNPAARPLAAAAALALATACALFGPRPLEAELLAGLAARAEQARGLRFPAPIVAERVPPRRVRALLAAELDAAYGPEDFARAEVIEHALGLLPAGTRLREALLDLQAGAVAGFYTPLRRRLYVVADGPLGAELPEDAASVAVHELVHALQAAHTTLLDVLLGLDDHDDLAFALGALLEGDALWATFRDQAERAGSAPPAAADFAAEIRLDDPEGPGAEAPRILRESFLLQYPLGYALAETLAERGGTAALDAALADPPLSSEALLHPERYLAEPREPVPWLSLAPPELALGGCRVVASNVFGELGLRIWARERGVAEADAAGAAEGWDGDCAAVFECAGESAFAWLVQFDAEAEAAEFASVAEAAALEGTDLSRSGRRVLLSGGLGPDARRAVLEAPERRFADLAGYLAARPEVLERAARLRERVRR